MYGNEQHKTFHSIWIVQKENHRKTKNVNVSTDKMTSEYILYPKLQFQNNGIICVPWYTEEGAGLYLSVAVRAHLRAGDEPLTSPQSTITEHFPFKLRTFILLCAFLNI